jgi:insertion element IS1 protein InsB
MKSQKHPPCPRCQSTQTVRNGYIHTGKQKYACKNCRRQFVENPLNKPISAEQKNLIQKLLLEKIPLAGIARVVGVSESWLQKYVNQFYATVPREVTISPKKRRLTLECDEIWSFVGRKSRKVWIWLALDRESREIVAVHIGNRSKRGAKKLWAALPESYRQTARCYTDFWAAYAAVFPPAQHRAVGKETGKTSHIERFNNTLRQRVSRLVRKTLSFSKKLENHIGAIWYFIHHYNASLQT